MRYSLIRLCSLAIACAAAASAAAAPKIARPEIVPRAAWAAKPPNTALMQAHTPRGIVIHHTAEKQQPQRTLQEKLQRLQKYSQAQGVDAAPKPAWGDVAYHFYIDAKGSIGEGRDINYAGDTNTAYDTKNRIQIVLEGHFDQERPTLRQLRSLDRLVLWLAAKHQVPAMRISGHSNHVADTDCPGRNLRSYLPQLRRKVASALPRSKL